VRFQFIIFNSMNFHNCCDYIDEA